MSLSGKRILFVSPSFFGYEKEICKELERKGASVVFVSSTFKSLLESIPIIRNLLCEYKKRERKKMFSSSFDALLVIKDLDIDLVNLFKQNNAYSTMILYQYDSISRYSDIQYLFPLFDTVFSFEPNDCKKYNLLFRPLFYIGSYLIKNEEVKYDISSISSYYPNRLHVFNQIKRTCLNKKIKFRLYLNWKSLLTSKLRVYLFNFRLFSCTSLSSKEVAKISSQSIAVLDIPNEKQQGLTIRTIESLALAKKIITTNTSIKEYDFYNSNNVFVLNNNFNEINSFLSLPYMPPPKEILDKYSLESFVNDIFSL